MGILNSKVDIHMPPGDTLVGFGFEQYRRGQENIWIYVRQLVGWIRVGWDEKDGVGTVEVYRGQAGAKFEMVFDGQFTDPVELVRTARLYQNALDLSKW